MAPLGQLHLRSRQDLRDPSLSPDKNSLTAVFGEDITHAVPILFRSTSRYHLNYKRVLKNFWEGHLP